MIGVGRAGRGRPTGSRARIREPLMGSWQALDLESIDAEADRPYWIAISLVPGVGGVGFARLLRDSVRRAPRGPPVDELLDCLPRRPQDAKEG